MQQYEARFERGRKDSRLKARYMSPIYSTQAMERMQKNSTIKRVLHKQDMQSSNVEISSESERFYDSLSPFNDFAPKATSRFKNDEVTAHDERNYFLTASLRFIFDFVVGLFYNADEIYGKMSHTKTNQCSEFKIVDLAVVYDSSYCSSVNGRENAESQIASIVSLVSKKFQQNGLCLKVELSYLEGYCNAALDPYRHMVRDGVDSEDLLSDFRSFWIENRQDINRTVAHLFTGTSMSENALGRAYIGTICSKDVAFAVNTVSWSSSLTLKAGLITHELGHNVGAIHVDLNPNEGTGCISSQDFIMTPEISGGNSGFHEESIARMRKVIESRSCMRTTEV